jgi:hypothetical protein
LENIFAQAGFEHQTVAYWATPLPRHTRFDNA